MKISMHVEGGAELAKALDSLSTRVSGRLLREVLLEASEPIRQRARSMAPRAPGAPDMADHIESMTLRGGYEGAPAVVVGPTRGFFYAMFQEFGTSRHSAQPFMRPAFDSEGQRAVKTITSALWRELAAKGVHQVVSAPSFPMGEV